MTKEKNISKLSPVPLDQIAFGIRFSPRYEMLDNLGNVIDRILRSDGSPFNEKVFPYSDRDLRQHSLINPDTNDEIRLTDSDIILQKTIETREMSEVERVAKDYENYILNHINSVVKLKNIIRYGVLFRLDECSNVIKEPPAEHFLKQDFNDVNSLSLRFTRRLPVEEALARRDVDDYRNIIFTVKQTEEGKIQIWVDYQEFYIPLLGNREFNDKPFSKFVSRGIHYFYGEFQNWLTKLIGNNKAA